MQPMPNRSLLAAALLLAGTTLAACGGSDDNAKDAGSSGLSCSYPKDGGSEGTADAPPSTPTYTADRKAIITLSAGAVPLTLHGGEAPCTVNSFASLAKQGYFDGTTCHRLTTEGIFVLQCGDPTGTGSGGPGYSFADELKGADALRDDPVGQGAKTYAAGTVAMANAGADTNGSQFFLVYADSPLPPAYAVFGTMDAAGLKVVQDIGATGTADGSADGAPKNAVTIKSVSVS
jgi:peptidyl-prolyl cis-trans isomerase B (cyclophilin B)